MSDHLILNKIFFIQFHTSGIFLSFKLFLIPLGKGGISYQRERLLINACLLWKWPEVLQKLTIIWFSGCMVWPADKSLTTELVWMAYDQLKKTYSWAEWKVFRILIFKWRIIFNLMCTENSHESNWFYFLLNLKELGLTLLKDFLWDVHATLVVTVSWLQFWIWF